METREHLLALGEDAVRSKGFGGFSYADLAKAAGIRKASVHHHFPAKADLGLALIEQFAARLDAVIGAIAQESQTGREGLEQVVAVYRDALGDADRMCLCAALAADSAILSDAMRSALASANETVVGHLTTIIAQGRNDGSLSPGLDAKALATSLLARLQGAQLIAKAAGNIALYDAAVAGLATGD